MIVFAKTEAGVLELEVEASLLVSELKALIEQKGGPAQAAQQIVYAGRTLREGSLAENDVKKESSLVVHSFALDRTAAAATELEAFSNTEDAPRCGASYTAPAYTALLGV